MRFERNTIQSRIDGTWREWHGNLRTTDIIFSKEKDANGHKSSKRWDGLLMVHELAR